jgi:hypothetical protein
MNDKRTDVKCNFRGQVILVTKDVDKFIHTVLTEWKPNGLQVSIESFGGTYGELLHRDSKKFHISASKGPCRVICAQCEVEFDEQTIASLGPNSVMAAFGVPPVTKCLECGSSNIIIVSE